MQIGESNIDQSECILGADNTSRWGELLRAVIAGVQQIFFWKQVPICTDRDDCDYRQPETFRMRLS